MSVALADRYHRRRMDLSGRNVIALGRIWPHAEPWDIAGSLRWHELAQPVLATAADAAVDLTAAYAEALGARPSIPPASITADSAAGARGP